MNDGTGRVVVQELSKWYGPVLAVDRLTFTVEPGRVTGFLGPNGSGKTSTLRMLLGLVRPTAGAALVNGLPYARLVHPARVVGAVLDAQGFHPGRSARRHLLACAAAVPVPDGAVDHVLRVVDLAGVGDRAVGGFSLGMRQRLALAAALLGDPQVLVLDEPANGLDPEGIAWLRGFLRDFAAHGRTVLVSSHLLAEVEQTADHLVVINNGRCVYQGGLGGLRGPSRVLVRCADPGLLADTLAGRGIIEIDTLGDGRLLIAGTDPVQVGDLALAAGIAIYGLAEERVDLERVFLDLTGAPR